MTTITSDQILHTVTHAWDGAASSGTSVEYTDGIETRRNLVSNPSFESGYAGWNTSGTLDISRAHSGGNCMLMQTINGNTNYCYMTGYLAVTPGDAWSASVWVFAPADLSVTYYLQAITQDASGTTETYFTSSTGIKFATDGWTRIALSLTVPEGGVLMTVGVSPSNETPGPSDALYVDDFLVEKSGATGDYFDGSTPAFPVYGQSRPLLVDGWEESVETRNVVNNIVGGGIDITPYPADLRTGQYVAVFQDEDDAADLVQMHRKPGQFWIIDDERPSISMTYVPNGTITRALDDESREFWLVTIPFQEVGA